MTTKKLTPEADEAVSSLIEAFRLWLQQLVWLPGCLVTDVTDAATGWIICRITADAGGTVAGANQRCRWRQLFEIVLNDVVDILYDPRTMMFEIFKPGGGTGVGTHALLGTMHDDTTIDAPTRGSLVYVPVGGDWDELDIGTTGFFLKPNGTDIDWARFSGQTVMVGPDASTEYNTINAAVAAIGDAAANKPYIVLVCGDQVTEAGNVTMKDFVNVVGLGDGVTIVMGANNFNMDDDSSLLNVKITFTAGGYLDISSKDRVILEHVHGTQTSNDPVVNIDGTSSDVEGKDCWFEGTGTQTVTVADTAVARFDNCKIEGGVTGGDYGLILGNSANVTTLWCQITGTIPVGMFDTSTWNHAFCQFDPDACILIAGENPLVTGKANFDDEVTFEDGIMLEEMAAAPGNVANAGWMYTKDDGGDTELFYEDDDGTELQLTEGGQIPVNNWDCLAWIGW